MTKLHIIATLIAPNAARVDFMEGETGSDVHAKIVLLALPAEQMIKPGQVNKLLFGHATTTNGWTVEKAGAIVTKLADGTTPAAPEAAAAPATPAQAAASPAAAAVKAQVTRKPRAAKVANAAPVAKGRVEKIYKPGPQAAAVKGTGVLAKIVDAVKNGVNTQAKLFEMFADVKKSTVQHEICVAQHESKKFLVIDQDGMKKAQAEAAAKAKADAKAAEAAAKTPEHA